MCGRCFWRSVSSLCSHNNTYETIGGILVFGCIYTCMYCTCIMYMYVHLCTMYVHTCTCTCMYIVRTYILYMYGYTVRTCIYITLNRTSTLPLMHVTIPSIQIQYKCMSGPALRFYVCSFPVLKC